MHSAATTDGNEFLHSKFFSRLTENFKRVEFQFFAYETERRRKPKRSLKIYRQPIRAGTKKSAVKAANLNA
ncbi:hypothetical protein, partial [Parasutterella sp.]|uniref:hypothetical protein n=1 Tax=Parasutterella sp. TaxID=2049037 RepID=UPI00307BB82D